MKDSPESQAREAWPLLRAAAAKYGVNWIEKPGSAQVKLIATRIREDGLTAKQLEQIIHGFIVLRGTTPDGDFNPLKYLYPKTLYRPANWPDYLAAGEAPPKRKAKERTVPLLKETQRPPGRLAIDMSQDEIDEMIKEHRKGTQFER